MISSRRLSDLTPAASLAATRWLAECKLAGLDILVYCTYRDEEAQNELFKIGRTAVGANPRPGNPMGNKVTNARGGQSAHQSRLALDFVPLIHGKAWKHNDVAEYQKAGEIAEKNGFEWAGRWTKFKETAHIQFKLT